MSLAGRICLVTGASRGIGRGIALQLGQAGATVYITGRTKDDTTDRVGSLNATAKEIESRGGRCIPVACDHSNDKDVDQLFQRITNEQNGRLDVLVNNAYSGVEYIMSQYAQKNRFWQQPLESWDEINRVGLRNHYRCSVLASRLMVPRQSGLIVVVSSPAGKSYFLNVAYSIGKAACDRMASDCAIELKRHGVAYVSVWPGAVRTEVIETATQAMPSNLRQVFTGDDAESVEFSGKAVAHLAADPDVMKKTGNVLSTGQLAQEYGFTDNQDKTPSAPRNQKSKM